MGLVLLFAWPATGSAASQRVSGDPHAYAYDSELHPGRPLDIQTERGPPATTYARVSAPAVADHVSDGPQMRPDTLTAYGYTTYDVPTSLEHIDKGTGTTLRPFQANEEGSSALQSGLVAANNVPTVMFSRSRAPGIAGNFDNAVANGAPTRCRLP